MASIRNTRPEQHFVQNIIIAQYTSIGRLPGDFAHSGSLGVHMYKRYTVGKLGPIADLWSRVHCIKDEAQWS